MQCELFFFLCLSPVRIERILLYCLLRNCFVFLFFYVKMSSCKNRLCEYYIYYV